MIKGQKYTTVITAILGDDNLWKVTATTAQAKSEDLETWEERKLEALAFNESLQVAFTMVETDLQQELLRVEGDLFGEEIKE